MDFDSKINYVFFPSVCAVLCILRVKNDKMSSSNYKYVNYDRIIMIINILNDNNEYFMISSSLN
jgi:hypothetical protein